MEKLKRVLLDFEQAGEWVGEMEEVDCHLKALAKQRKQAKSFLVMAAISERRTKKRSFF